MARCTATLRRRLDRRLRVKGILYRSNRETPTMSTLARPMSLYSHRTHRAPHTGHGMPVPMYILQRGGAIKTYTEYYLTHPLTVREVPEYPTDVNIDPTAEDIRNADPNTAHEVTVSAGLKSAPCFVMNYVRATQTAVLETVEGRNPAACFTDGYRNMREVVRIAYRVARRLGARTFEITDNSYIACPSEEGEPLGPNVDNDGDDATVVSNPYAPRPSSTAKIRLAHWSLLTTGQTWYESCLPVPLVPTDPLIRTALPEWRRRVQTNTWREVAGPLFYVLDSTGIDVDASGSAMAVLARAKTSRNVDCRVIAAHLRELRIRSGITKTLFGSTWVAQIPSPAARRRTTARATAERRRQTQRRPATSTN